MRSALRMRSLHQKKLSIGAFTISVVCLMMIICAASLIYKSQSSTKRLPAITELQLKPAPTRVYENSTADCWIVLTPNGYFEFVTVDNSKPLNAHQKSPMVVRLFGSYREIPKKLNVDDSRADAHGYTIIFNVDPKSVVSLSKLPAAPGWLSRWGFSTRNRITEFLEDYCSASYTLDNTNIIFTNIRMIQSVSTFTKAVVIKNVNPDKYARIGLVRYDRLLLESKPDGTYR